MKNQAKLELTGLGLTLHEISDLVNSQLSEHDKVNENSCTRYITMLRYKDLGNFIQGLYASGCKCFPFSAFALKSSG